MLLIKGNRRSDHEARDVCGLSRGRGMHEINARDSTTAVSFGRVIVQASGFVPAFKKYLKKKTRATLKRLAPTGTSVCTISHERKKEK